MCCQRDNGGQDSRLSYLNRNLRTPLSRRGHKASMGADARAIRGCDVIWLSETVQRYFTLFTTGSGHCVRYLQHLVPNFRRQ